MTTPSTYGSATADGGVGPHPTNGIVVSGKPNVQYLNLETATECYPTRLVTKGTHDNDIAVCGVDGVPIGVLGYEHAAKKFRPATRDTIYVVDSQVPVLNGPGTVVLLTLADNQTVVKGDRLVPAANGKVAKASAAIAPSGTLAVVAASTTPTMVGPVATEGIVFAIAEESVTSVDVPGFIAARLLQ